MKKAPFILPFALTLYLLISPEVVCARPQNKSAAESATPTAKATEGNKELVGRWAQAIWNRDLALSQALVTDDCVIHADGSTYGKGPEGVKQWLTAGDPNWGYGAPMTDDIIAEDDKVVRRTTVFRMYKPNHRLTVRSVIFIYRVANGKIAEVWQVANDLSAYQQAGAQIVMPGANPSVKKTDAEEEVLKAKQEFDDAALHNDAEGRARFYTDDYTAVYGDGTIGDKAKQLERVRSGRLRYFARTAEDVIVRVYGDTAVVIERRKQTATFDGKPRPSDVRATEVWVRHEGRWRQASISITPVLEPGQSPARASTANQPLLAQTGPETPNGASEAEREVLKAAEELNDASRRGDADALSRIYGDDYLFVGYAGFLDNKQGQVEAFRTGFMKTFPTTIDVRVRVYGNTAVVIRRRKQVATVGTRHSEGYQCATGVWVRREGRWQLVSAQVTPILDPEFK